MQSRCFRHVLARRLILDMLALLENRGKSKMAQDTLQKTLDGIHAAWGPISTDVVANCRQRLQDLLKATPDEKWLAGLHAEKLPNKELHRDPAHGYVLLAHTENKGLYRNPHDHGRAWVVYAIQSGEVEMGTYARIENPDGGFQLVKRDSYVMRAGQVQAYLPGDIHDTRCLSDTALLFRFTERDLKKEDREEGRLSRYQFENGVWSVMARQAA